MLEDELLEAVFMKDAQRVEELIEEGVNVNVFDNDNVTPLMYSVIASDYEIARILVENGADVDYVVPEGKFEGDTALKIAEVLDDKKMQNILQRIDDEDEIDDEGIADEEYFDDLEIEKQLNKEKNKFIKRVLLVFLICIFLFVCLHMFNSTFSIGKTVLFAFSGICVVRLLYFFKF